MNIRKLFTEGLFFIFRDYDNEILKCSVTKHIIDKINYLYGFEAPKTYYGDYEKRNLKQDIDVCEIKQG